MSGHTLTNNTPVQGKAVILATTPRTDVDIASAVRRALESEALIPSRRIQVAVSNGWVALLGKVALSRERDAAVSLVRCTEACAASTT